jgi:hypothetical protein
MRYIALKHIVLRFMKKNVGGLDRGLRFAIGISGLAIAVFGRVGVFGRLKGLFLGTAAFYSAATEFCPISEYLGVDTHDVETTRRTESILEHREEVAAAVSPVI